MTDGPEVASNPQDVEALLAKYLQEHPDAREVLETCLVSREAYKKALEAMVGLGAYQPARFTANP